MNAVETEAALIWRRPSNALPEHLIFIDGASSRWGKAAREAEHLGLPAITILGRLIEQGPGAGQASGGVHVTREFMVIDAGVAKLPGHLRNVFRQTYMRWEDERTSARRCHLSLGTYRVHLKQAREAIRMFWEAAQGNPQYDF